MRIYKYLHSCIVLEENGKRILIDPGNYAFASGRVRPEVFEDISAILITHSHSDHVDARAIEKILEKNKAMVYGDSETKKALGDIAMNFEEIHEGQTLSIGPFTIKIFAVAHGKGVLGPVPYNLAFLVNDMFLDPGDSLDQRLLSLKGIKVLALPVIAPWNTRLEMATFGADLTPEIILPIHDGFVADFFEKSQNEHYKKFFMERGIAYHPLAVGEFVEI